MISHPGTKLATTGEVVAFANGDHNGARGGWPDACKLHELFGLCIVLGGLGNLFVVLVDALIQTSELTQGLTHYRVAPAGQVFELLVGLAAHGARTGAIAVQYS